MGSSPVTATTFSAESRLLSTLNNFFDVQFSLPRGSCVVVAFSGGPDSLALLWGLRELARVRGLSLLAGHLDHGLDPESAERRAKAERLASQLGIPAHAARRDVLALRRPGESLEAAARRVRYDFLEETRKDASGVAVATAHHLDDQAETLLLRLRSGSGWRGLAGIRPAFKHLIRPLLTLSRQQLLEAVSHLGLQPTDDPTNLLPIAERNRIRRGLVPTLDRSVEDLAPRLARVAECAHRLVPAIDRRLLSEIQARRLSAGVTVSRQALLRLPRSLGSAALAALHAWVGAPYPASEAATAELFRQLALGRVRCDCGRGLRWECDGSDSIFLRSGPAAAPSPFSYTFEVPGETVLEALGLRLRLSLGQVQEWMFRAWSLRAGLKLDLEPGDRVEIRSRRPGDRIRPFGHANLTQLKCLLINRKVPRLERDLLPLLVVNGNIAWVPGVTVDDRCRVQPGGYAWTAEIVPLAGP